MLGLYEVKKNECIDDGSAGYGSAPKTEGAGLVPSHKTAPVDWPEPADVQESKGLL